MQAWYCENPACDNEIPEPTMCCDGHECGCMGKPIEPPVCSEKCFRVMYPHTGQNKRSMAGSLREKAIRREICGLCGKIFEPLDEKDFEGMCPQCEMKHEDDVHVSQKTIEGLCSWCGCTPVFCECVGKREACDGE